VYFQWNAGTNIQEYFLYVGNTQGANDIYGNSQGPNLAATVSGLPADGRTLYVRLWSRGGANWYYEDYVYVAARTAPASMVTPYPGATLGTSVMFRWNSGTNIQQYWLYLGSTQGGSDLYGNSQGTSLSATVTGLPTDGRTLYVRLWSLSGTNWYFQDYVYQMFNSH
jgi:serine protease